MAKASFADATIALEQLRTATEHLYVMRAEGRDADGEDTTIDGLEQTAADFAAVHRTLLDQVVAIAKLRGFVHTEDSDEADELQRVAKASFADASIELEQLRIEAAQLHVTRAEMRSASAGSNS